MINKLVLQNVINKYHLGEIEQVKWKTSNKTLSIDFMSLNKEVIGNITHKDFDLEDSELAVYETKRLLSLLSITQGDLLVNLEKIKSIYTKMHFADNNFNLTYALSDPLLIGKVGSVTEPEWDAVMPLEKENVDNIIKAKSALTGEASLTLTIETDLNGDNMCVFTFGDEHGHNNKITYQLYGNIKKDTVSLPFNSNILKTILNVNKDLENGTMYLSYKGLMKLEFEVEGTQSTYYIIRQEQSAF